MTVLDVVLCSKGLHLMTEANTIVYGSDGYPRCRACRNDSAREYRRRNPDVAAPVVLGIDDQEILELTLLERANGRSVVLWRGDTPDGYRLTICLRQDRSRFLCIARDELVRMLDLEDRP